MEALSLPQRPAIPDAQLVMLSTAGLTAWVTTFRNRPPVLSISALGSEIRVALSHADRRAGLTTVRQLATVISTFADMTESGWLYPTVPRPQVTDEVLRRVIAGLKAL